MIKDKTYRFPRSSKITINILILFFNSISFYFFISEFITNGFKSDIELYFFAGILIILSFIGIRYFYRTSFYLGTELFKLQSTFKFLDKQVEHSNIKGFRALTGDFIILELKTPQGDVLNIPKSLEHSDEILQNLRLNFIDLDSKEIEESKQEINNNIEFGENPSIINTKLNNARWYCISINFLCFVYLISNFFTLPFWAYIGFPIFHLVSIVIGHLSFRGLIRVNNLGKLNAYPSLIIGILLLFLPYIRTVAIINFSFEFKIILYVGLSVVFFLSILFLLSKELYNRSLNEKLSSILGSTILYSGYFLGLFFILNVGLDKKEHIINRNKRRIIEKQFTNALTHGSINVNGWKNQSTNEFYLSNELYRETEIGDTIILNEFPGFFGIKWIAISK